MAEDTSSNKKPVFDVSHPGTSTPSATSKPVIVGSGAIMKDPMVQGKTDTEDKDETPVTVRKSKVIQPLHEDTDEETSEDDATEKSAKKDTQEAPKPQAEFTASTTLSDDTKTADSKDEADDKNAEEKEEDEAEPKNAIVDAVIDQTAGKKNSTKSTATETDENIQKHIEEKTYFVKVSHTSSSHAVAIVVILLLIGVIAGVFYVAEQQGIISISL